MPNLITVSGSHGELLVHASSGHIVSRSSCDCSDCQPYGGGYSSIAFFDPARWSSDALEHGSTDILATAFVDHAGYCRELAWVGANGDGWWDELPLLCAPVDHGGRA